MSKNYQQCMPLPMQHRDHVRYLEGSFYLAFKLGTDFKEQMVPVLRCILADIATVQSN